MVARYETMPWQDLGPAQLPITQVKAIRYDTDLIEDGVAGFLIVAPDEPAYRDLAFSLEEAILGMVSGPRRVVSADELIPEQQYTLQLIALGNIGNNPLLLDLYHHYYVAVDHAYPGAGGHVLQTVYDPWGHGTNVIVCGGSDLAGVAEAVSRARTALRREDGRTYYARLHDIAISQTFIDQHPTVSFECTSAHREWLVDLAYRRIAQGEHRRAMPVLSHAGLMYNLTGDDGFAAAYRDVFKVVYQSALSDSGSGPWSPWGFDADFQSAPVLGAWDVVEESPVLTDEDRLYMTNHMLYYVQYMYGHAQTHKPSKPTPRHNHYTFAALGLLLGAQYYAKYYRWPEAEDWLREADDCFQRQARAFKANEDCNSYQWLTFFHTLRYSLIRPDPAFLDSGMARFCLDLGIATMDNLGYQVPHGDVREYAGTFSEIPYYRAVASLLRDPVYAPVLAHKEQVRPHYVAGRTPPSGFAPNSIQTVGYDYALDLGEGRPLVRYLGVASLPVEPLYYEAFDGPEQIAYEKTFDKIVFRQSHSPQDPYLLVDGLSNGGHLHYDGNAILRYTDKERIWLEDADYMKVSQKFHNSVLVFRDGVGALVPSYMEFGEATWLAPFGYSRSTARGYAGTDWTRHVLQREGRYFLVIDEIVANDDGDYDLRCLWRGVGDATLDTDARRFVISQDGPQMELCVAPGHSSPTALAYKEERMIWGSWENYPHHGRTPDTKVLQERASVRLTAGERYLYFNLFGTEGPYPSLQRLNEDVVRIADRGALTGTGRGLATLASLTCDAALIYADGRQAFLAGVTEVALDGRPLLQASAAVSLRVEREGEMQCVIAGGCSLTVGDQTNLLAPGTHALTGDWAEPLFAVLQKIAATEDVAAPIANRSRRSIRGKLDGRPQGNLLWKLSIPDGDAPYRIALHDDGEQLYIGTLGGVVHAVRDGQVAWSFETGGCVNSLALDDVNGDGRAEVVVGSDDCHVYLLDANGQEIWRHEIPYYMHRPTVEVVMVADLGERGRAIVAGSNNCHIHALAPEDGHELWRYEVIHGVNDVTAADMNGDGVNEVLAVTEWWTWHRVTAEGQGLWKYWAVRPHYTPGANVVRAGDVNGDGVPEMVVGAIDTCVYAFDAAGERLWEFFTGEEIAALQLVDVNGDGLPEIVAGGLNGYVYALDGGGRLLWKANLEEEVNSLTIVGEGSSGSRIVAGTDGPLAFVLGLDGQVLASVDAGGPVRQVAASADNGLDTVYVAGRTGTVAAYTVQVT